MNYYTFTRDVRRHLEKTGMRRKELAQRAGITKETVSRIAAGHRRASEPLARRIAQAWAEPLGVNAEQAFALLFQPAPLTPRVEFERVPQRISA
jgi:transcriptional regulator with XRE-family HTH domain